MQKKKKTRPTKNGPFRLWRNKDDMFMYNEKRQSFGCRIGKLIAKRHMTRKELAIAIPVNPSTLDSWLKHQSAIPAFAVLKLADVLKTNGNYLLGLSMVDDPQFIYRPTDLTELSNVRSD